MFGDMVVRLFTLRSVEPADEEKLFPLGRRRKFALEHGWIVGIWNNWRTQGPANANIEEFQSDPPLGKVRVVLGFTVHYSQMVKGCVLQVEPNSPCRGNGAAIHGRTLLVGEDG